jgi:hypothetical protein
VNFGFLYIFLTSTYIIAHPKKFCNSNIYGLRIQYGYTDFLMGVLAVV